MTKSFKEFLKEALTPKRANELLGMKKMGSSIPKAFRAPSDPSTAKISAKGISRDEDKHIRKVWGMMPGNTSYEDAIRKISKGVKEDKEKKDEDDSEDVKANLEEGYPNATEIRNHMNGFVGPDFAKKADDDDIIAMAKLMDEKSNIYNQHIKRNIEEINKLRKKYRLKGYKMVTVPIDAKTHLLK